MNAHKRSLNLPLDPRIAQLADECKGPILDAILDESITEVMLNPDGILWVEERGIGMREYGSVSFDQAERIVRKVAGIQGMTAYSDRPILECEFPIDHSRFEAILPSIVAAPSFTIRKKARLIYTFSDYVAQGSLSLSQAEVILDAIMNRKNILICGGPGSGKTTFTNACLHELTRLSSSSERLLILEDVPELQCAAHNVLRMTTNLLLSQPVDLEKLVAVAMRSRPDRILIGEVRDKAMLALMKAWNTGCPGGIATLHANDTHSAIERCLSLSEEAGVARPVSLLLETIQVIVFVERDPKTLTRRIKNVSQLMGYSQQNGAFLFKELA